MKPRSKPHLRLCLITLSMASSFTTPLTAAPDSAAQVTPQESAAKTPQEQDAPAVEPGQPGSPLPAFSLINDFRRRVPSSEFLGQVVLIDFWATWCLPCRYTLPELQKLHERFGKEGLQVLGLSIDRGARGGFAARRFAKGLNITYPIFHDVTQDRASRALGVSNIPDLVLVDQEGVIRQRWIGEPDFAEVTATVEALLSPSSSPSPNP